MERIQWIDFLRGISMITILFFHTEVYYKENHTPYYIYTTNAIILFYFISGYLLYNNSRFKLKKRIISIVRSLLIPYFIFTTLIALPKLLIRQLDINWTEIVVNILMGRASWFIAALIVGKLLFSILLKISRGNILLLSTVAIIFLITYYLIPFNQYNIWQWQDALLAFVFLYSGYVYHQYKQKFQTINKPIYSLLLLTILILIKIYEYNNNLSTRNIAITNVPLFLVDTITWLVLITTLINYIPRCKIIECTGEHSIVYYFLAGGCPLIVSLFLDKVGLDYDDYLWRYMLAFVLVYTLATIFTWLIYQYIPIITGKSKL